MYQQEIYVLSHTIDISRPEVACDFLTNVPFINFRIKIKTLRGIGRYQKITKVKKNGFEGKTKIF